MRVAVCSKPGLCDHTAFIARVALAAVTAEERDWPAKIRTSWRLTGFQRRLDGFRIPNDAQSCIHARAEFKSWPITVGDSP